MYNVVLLLFRTLVINASICLIIYVCRIILHRTHLIPLDLISFRLINNVQQYRRLLPLWFISFFYFFILFLKWKIRLLFELFFFKKANDRK